MSNPFSSSPETPRPSWSNIPTPNGNFQALSGTGQLILTGGYGLGTYGGGAYGTGDDTTASNFSFLNTTWTNSVLK